MSAIGATINPTTLGGGPYQGWSPKQTVLNYKSNANVIDRKLVVRAWYTPAATGQINGYNRVTTPFRAVNSSGDFLARMYYNCGGANQVNVKRPGLGGKGVINAGVQLCDTTGVPAANTNTRFVPDSSDYTKYRRLRSVNRNFNDSKFGGDDHNASFVNRMAVHRGLS